MLSYTKDLLLHSAPFSCCTATQKGKISHKHLGCLSFTGSTFTANQNRIAFPLMDHCPVSSKGSSIYHANKTQIIVISLLKLGGTCKQHLQWQRHEGLILQMVLPCIVASYVYHTNEAIFEMDLLQLRYFLYKSVIISNIKRWALLSVL